MDIGRDKGCAGQGRISVSPAFVIATARQGLVLVGQGIKKRPRGADVYRGHHMIYSSRIGQSFMFKYCLAFCALGRHSLIRD